MSQQQRSDCEICEGCAVCACCVVCARRIGVAVPTLARPRGRGCCAGSPGGRAHHRQFAIKDWHAGHGGKGRLGDGNDRQAPPWTLTSRHLSFQALAISYHREPTPAPSRPELAGRRRRHRFVQAPSSVYTFLGHLRSWVKLVPGLVVLCPGFLRPPEVTQGQLGRIKGWVSGFPPNRVPASGLL